MCNFTTLNTTPVTCHRCTFYSHETKFYGYCMKQTLVDSNGCGEKFYSNPPVMRNQSACYRFKEAT